MDITTLPSVSEVLGVPGSGRNSFCLAMAADVPSLWIERHKRFNVIRAQSVRLDLSEVFNSHIRSESHLLLSLESGEISDFVKDHKIKLVVINTLPDYYLLPNEYRKCIPLVNCLKRLYIKHAAKSLLISGTPYIRYENCFDAIVHNAGWIYAVPAQFHISRTDTPSKRQIVLLKPKTSPPLTYTMELGASFIKIS